MLSVKSCNCKGVYLKQQLVTSNGLGNENSDAYLAALKIIGMNTMSVMMIFVQCMEYMVHFQELLRGYAVIFIRCTGFV